MHEKAATLIDVEMRVLATISKLLAQTAQLTEDVEATIGRALNEKQTQEDWMLRDIQQLDLLRQMQADLSRVLEHLSANGIHLEDLEDLKVLDNLCQVRMVRDALHASVKQDDQISEIQDNHTDEAGQIQIF